MTTANSTITTATSIEEIDNNNNMQCRIGKAPWQDLTHDEYKAYLQDFYHNIWKRRPSRENIGGGGFFHYFALYTVVKRLQPTAIVESGAWHGVGTWFLRQSAGPDVKIVVLSPIVPKTYIDDLGPDRSLYKTGNDFVDFAKTTAAQWKEWVPNVETTLLFIDDHQAGVNRFDMARKLGFKHVVFDDNYPPGEGDNLTLKHVCLGKSLWEFLHIPDNAIMFRDNFNQVKRKMSPGELKMHQERFFDNVAVYAEFPPVWPGPRRFASLKALSTQQLAQMTERPIFSSREELMALGVSEEELPGNNGGGSNHMDGFDAEALKYTFIVYAQAKKKQEIIYCPVDFPAVTKMEIDFRPILELLQARTPSRGLLWLAYFCGIARNHAKAG